MTDDPRLPDGDSSHFVSRAGFKLAHALDAFQIDPTTAVCVDLGSHVGGFVDCLLQRGAQRVYSVDTSYGTLDWRLRKDDRVVVMERTNAMRVTIPEPVDLVTIDVGWTPLHLVVPGACAMLNPGGAMVALIKPHYEAEKGLRKGVLPEERLQPVIDSVLARLGALGAPCENLVESPILGTGGNKEFLALLRPLPLDWN
jgi:23S rRNA (cytidine1920-2'-O)/16S rRNA (cytidine1409-2'-O)-methyltransferase